ncbi:hypothetical protein WDW86_16850 [Bdellovibrionota bacterium FG-2]
MMPRWCILLLFPSLSAFAGPQGSLLSQCVVRPAQGAGPARICYPNRTAAEVSPFGEI